MVQRFLRHKEFSETRWCCCGSEKANAQFQSTRPAKCILATVVAWRDLPCDRSKSWVLWPHRGGVCNKVPSKPSSANELAQGSLPCGRHSSLLPRRNGASARRCGK